MAELGMDPQAVLAMAGKLEQQQRTITHIGSSVDRVVAEARSCWKGADVERFAGQWATHKADLRTASTALHELATKAKTNAQAQIKTSNDYAGGLGGTGNSASGWTGSSGHAQGGSTSGSGSFGGVTASGSASGEVGHGGEGEVHGSVGPDGLDASAQGSAWTGAHGQAHGEVSAGGITAEANAHGEVGAGADGRADLHVGRDGIDGSIEGRGWEGARGGIDGRIGTDDYNVNGHIDGFAGTRGEFGSHLAVNGDGLTYGAHAEGFSGLESSQGLGVHTPIGDSSIEATERAGVGGSVDSSLSVTRDGFAQHAGFDYFAGTSEGVTQTTHIGAFTVGGGASFLQGEGLGYGSGFTANAHNIGFDANGDIAEELGLSGEAHVHVDPTELAHEAGDLGGWAEKHAPWHW